MNEPDIPQVVDQLITGMALFKGHVLPGIECPKVMPLETDTEGPDGVRPKFRNAIELTYPNGDQFIVMVTAIPPRGGKGGRVGRNKTLAEKA